MNDMLNSMLARRSVRRYTDEPIPEQAIEAILAAALSSATGHAAYPWTFIVVRDPKTLHEMALCRKGGVRMLESAAFAVVALGDEQKSNTWIEDCSGAMTNMMLMASAMGLGSCWIQGRGREADDGRTSEEFLRALLHFPKNMRLEATLAVGMPESKPEPHEIDKLDWTKVREGRFDEEYARAD